MPGKCEFTVAWHIWHCDYDYHYENDEDKEQCLQSCLQKRRSVDDAAGCYFQKSFFCKTGQKSPSKCIFLKTGTIIGGSGDSDIGTCWKFGEGNVLYSLIFLHNISNINQSQISTFGSCLVIYCYS